MSLAVELERLDTDDLEIERLEIADDLQNLTIDHLGAGDPNILPTAVSSCSCATSACNCPCGAWDNC